MKKIVLLGSAGSIGESTLSVVEKLPDRLEVCALAVEKNYVRLLEQAKKFNVRHIAVADPAMAEKCRAEAGQGIKVYAGPEGVEEIAALAEADIVLCAVVGMAGLRPVLSASRAGKDIALATKEVLVAGGSLVIEECRKNGSRLLPVDSEHSALFQCLISREAGHEWNWDVNRLILTASGGPFALRPDVDLNKVTVEQALKHPSWSMGRKVTIDSATLMNKGLEIMEARWMFDVPVEKIEVVIHPESIIHSMVEFVDSSIIAQLSVPDMRLAIQFALTYPERVSGGLQALNFSAIKKLNFAEPDFERFPCLGLARASGMIGGTMPAVLNAANEIAVGKFLNQEISFSGIWRTVEKVMEAHRLVKEPSLDDVMAADRWARDKAGELA